MTLVAWLYIVRVTQNPLWWIGLVALILAWIYAGIRISSR